MSMVFLATYLGWAAAVIALFGTAYAFLAAILAARFMGMTSQGAGATPPVTILKPLHQGEPGLFENLETFYAQDYPGPVQIVFGVHDKADPALAVVRRLDAKYPGRDTAIVVDPSLYGANAKVSNLINMLPQAKHDTLVLSDSDIAVGPHWLARVTGALERPGVGIVTCFYTGEAAPGAHPLWSALSAMGTSYEFLPNAVLGTSLGLAAPCFGSTIALRRRTLDEVGGFAAFADFLADDYEIGRAVRARGYALAMPSLGVSHTAAEQSAGELVRHELRWNRTIRLVNPWGHLGSIVTFAVPFALLAAPLLHFSVAALAVVAAALAARCFLKYRIDAIFGTRAGPYWLLPLRDLLSFAVFLASLTGETVDWRGSRFAVEPSGAMSQS
jgi:ceramide glucosyltransferase